MALSSNSFMLWQALHTQVDNNAISPNKDTTATIDKREDWAGLNWTKEERTAKGKVAED